jgi:hypothetical protein
MNDEFASQGIPIKVGVGVVMGAFYVLQRGIPLRRRTSDPHRFRRLTLLGKPPWRTMYDAGGPHSWPIEKP